MATPARHSNEANATVDEDVAAIARPLPPPTSSAAAAEQVRPERPVAAPPVRLRAAEKPRWLTPAGIFSIAVVAMLYVGLRMPTERYITPKRGLGYALGILGGSMMLLLFLYSARKRIRWLKFLGPAMGWFRYHMILGVLGPLCILYHSNFGLGAANSNVALFSMLTVAGSGLIGRYIYARIHHGLYGSKLSLGELRKSVETQKASSGTYAFLPELAGRLEAVEGRLLSTGPRLPLLGPLRLVSAAVVAGRARWQLRRYIRRNLRAAAAKSAAVAGEYKRLRRTAVAYVDRRIAATRRVVGFQAYERLFSLWHALHLPLIFIMLAAGVVHVIAVHVY